MCGGVVTFGWSHLKWLQYSPQNKAEESRSWHALVITSQEERS